MSNKTPNKPSGKENQQKPPADPVEDLVYKGGYTKDPQEIVENPAVAPQMLNAPGDLRGDLMEED